MRIAISTDCWFPQIDGITRTLDATVRELRMMGHNVLLLTPTEFLSVGLPYGDALVLPWYPRLARLLRDFAPNSVHIATQGPLGVCVRMWCRRTGTHFTTAFHTRFPEYARVRHRIPEAILYRYARFFHGRSAPVLVPSRSLADELRYREIGRPEIWARGVDTDRFHPRLKRWTHYPRPILLYVGRVVAEKNIAAFLELSSEGTKIVAGDGPALPAMRLRSPDTIFLGALTGVELEECFAEADVFIFPSLLDTFGLVVLESLASGVPVAALPSPHLIELFGDSGVVFIDGDLLAAIRQALTCDPGRCRDVALQFSWRACTEQFVRIIENDLRARG